MRRGSILEGATVADAPEQLIGRMICPANWAKVVSVIRAA